LFCLLALLASQVVSGFANDRDVARRRQRPNLPRGLMKSPVVAALFGVRKRGTGDPRRQNV
jgi:hypothetical protein